MKLKLILFGENFACLFVLVCKTSNIVFVLEGLNKYNILHSRLVYNNRLKQYSADEMFHISWFRMAIWNEAQMVGM